MPGDLDLYSWAIFSDFDLGWLAAPLTLLLLDLCFLLFRGRQSWLGGLVSLAGWLGLFCVVCFAVSSNFESVNLLVTRLGLRPYSAWSKKNVPNSQGSVTPQSGAQSATTARNTASDGHSYAQTAIRGNVWRHDED